MLRYLVLLAAGGVYSDADTRALMPLAHWADGVQVYPTPLKSMTSMRGQGDDDSQQMQTDRRYPIRMIVSIEGDFHIWRDKVAL